jgi:uncharacterized protein YyaL (SSP411 family)
VKLITYHPFYTLFFCIAIIFAGQSSPLLASDLSQQASPYLRAHADDAVKWQPFDRSAFEQAKRLDKPILLTSGYLSCYWCHRMAEDGFRQASVGAVINERFVPILLDRELESEVDAYLQAFMTQQRGFGGWPLTVILTPDAQLVAGFSYQPAETLLKTISSFDSNWTAQRTVVEASAEAKVKRLGASLSSEADALPLNIKRLLTNFLSQTERIADNNFGGFGQAEKFPFAPQLVTLLHINSIQKDPQLRQFLETTFQAMLGGGLRDHVGGGFFRYSDTREWSAPHFEQMLYTQALLAPLLLEAGKQWRKPAYLEASREVLMGMIKFFQRDDGLFRAALSAVSAKGMAGGYYLWTDTELRQLLGEQLSAVYPLPLGGQSKYLPLIQVSGKRRLDIRNRLLNARASRKLKTDEKALLGWNGLALSALAGGFELSPVIRASGERLFKQLQLFLNANDLPRLIDDKTAGLAQLADQMYLAQGLYDWASVTQNESALKQLLVLLHQLYERYFLDGNWQAATDKPLIGKLRSAALVDDELPSPTGVWLEVSNQLLERSSTFEAEAGRKSLEVLELALNAVREKLPDTMEDNAFFHGTSLTALLKMTVQKHSQQEPSK